MNDKWKWQIVLIIPTATRANADKVAYALGYGSTNFSIPLFANGTGDASHFGCISKSQDGDLAILQGAGDGQLPDVDWTEFDLTEADVWVVFGSLLADVKSTPTDRIEQLDTFAAENNLVRIKREDFDAFRAATPLAETISIDEQGRATATPIDIQNKDLFQTAIEKVNDALQDAFGGNSIGKDSLVAKVLLRTLDKYRTDPQRVHDDFVLVDCTT